MLSLMIMVCPQPKPIFHGPRAKNRIALTFDACPTKKNGEGYDARIVQILKETKTPATFFLSGRWMEAEPSGARELAAEPLFELGNHSYSHPHMTAISEEEMQKELSATQLLLARITGGKQTYFFRPPFGEWDDRLTRMADQYGLQTIQYDLASGDPDPKIGADRLSDYVVRSIRGGSIVVLHVNGRGWHTAEALPAIIEGVRRRGMICLRLSELLSGGE
jgi:peptidoglycan/xylan/chitin deacetylase (PgdA/CDA1 family)